MRITLLAIAICAVHPAAWAGPPFITDDPEPVDHRHWEVNYAVTGTWGNGNASAGVPSVDVNYGVAPNVQLHAQPRYSHEKSGSEAHFGLDDTEVGVKYRFLDVQTAGGTWMVGIYPIYQLATGTRALGPDRGKGQAFLPLWIQRDTDKWTLYGGWGYRMNPGPGFKNSVFTGATAIYEVAKGFQLGAELFHETADTEGGAAVTGFNVGGILRLTRDYNLLFSAGQRASDQVAHSLYLAVQAHY